MIARPRSAQNRGASAAKGSAAEASRRGAAPAKAKRRLGKAVPKGTTRSARRASQATSRNARPASVPRKQHGEPADRTGRIKDFTSPIPIDRQLVPQRRGRLVVAVFATLIAVAIGAALFVLPIKSWLKQRDDLSTRTSELSTLTSANDQLEAEVQRLQTPDGIKEAARAEIDYSEAGEQRITILATDPTAVTLPAGWPFDQVTQIINIRRAEAAAKAAPPTTAVAIAPAVTVAAAAATTVAVAPAVAPTTAAVPAP